MTEEEKIEQAHLYGFTAALAYAKAQGWTPPEPEELVEASWQAWVTYEPKMSIKL